MSSTKKRAREEENGSDLDHSLHLRPTDVICGRGRYPQHPGNLTFLSLIHQRKAAYRDAPDRATKARLADEVRVAVMEGLDPPGRFVQRQQKSGGSGCVGGARKKRRRGGRGDERAEDDDEDDEYEIVEEVQVMEKIKQALRQKVGVIGCAAFVCSVVMAVLVPRTLPSRNLHALQLYFLHGNCQRFLLLTPSARTNFTYLTRIVWLHAYVYM